MAVNGDKYKTVLLRLLMGLNANPGRAGIADDCIQAAVAAGLVSERDGPRLRQSRSLSILSETLKANFPGESGKCVYDQDLDVDAALELFGGGSN